MVPQALLFALCCGLITTFGVEPVQAQSAFGFIATTVTLPNSRQGDEYFHNISGLITGGNGGLKFSKSSSSHGWVVVDSDGILSGTPDREADETVVTVNATDSGNAFATAQFTIPVRPAGAALVPELQVLTYNLWHGGTRVSNYHEKQVRFLATSGADVVGVQEDQSGSHAPRLANALGWHYWVSGGDTSILSKYPIAESYGVVSSPDRAGGVRIALDGERQQINLYVAHLGYTPYGPYDFCFDNMTKARVLEREAQSGRTPQIVEILASMDNHLSKADEIPVFLVGDLNAPSHLDWTEALKEKNCGYWDVEWPTSVLPEQKGLIDSFRVANPDPAKVQATTWSPITPWNSDRSLPEPQDRIDFIYHKGKSLKVLESRAVVVGEPKPEPDYQDNEWTSDHAAVLTSYEFTS